MPIVAEVREVKERLAARHAYDAEAMLRDVMRRQNRQGRKAVTLAQFSGGQDIPPFHYSIIRPFQADAERTEQDQCWILRASRWLPYPQEGLAARKGLRRGGHVV